MRYIVLLALIAGCVKNAPPALVAAVENRSKANLTCAPVPYPGAVPVGPQPAVITFYTRQPYHAARNNIYTTMVRTMLPQMVHCAGLPYVESMYQITTLNSSGFAAMQIRVSSVDCLALPMMVSQAKASNFLIKSATYQCGSGDVTQV